MKINIILTSIFVLSITGCATSDSLIVSKKADAIDNGILYSLPKQFLKVNYKRQPLTAKKAKAELDKEKVQFDSLTTSKAKKAGEIKVLNEFISKLDVNAAGHNQLLVKKQSELLELKTQLLLLTNQLQRSKDQLASKAVKYSQALGGVGLADESLTFVPTSVQPDPTMQFYAQVQHQPNFSDSIELKIKDGLLDGAVGHSEGKNDAIVSAFVSGLSGFGQLRIAGATGGNVPSLADVRRGAKCTSVHNVSMTIDPANSADIKELNTALSECLSISIKAAAAANVTFADASNSFANVSGLVYRQPGEFEITITNPSDKSDQRKERITLAQGGQIGFISLPKSGFAKNEYDLNFSKGSLTKGKVVLPSEALAVISIIPNALKAIFEVPTELIQLKINHNTAEAQLLDTQKALIQSTISLDEQQRLLDAELLQ